LEWVKVHLSRRRSLAGITIIEVLTCIAIIAILAALSFSVFRGSVGRSKVAVSTENLRQIHLAQTMYMSDHGDLPLMNIYHPDLKPYFGGTVPVPPLAPPREQWRDMLDWAYRIHGTKSSLAVDELTKECIVRRAGDIPIAHDASWTRPQIAASTRSPFYLYVRLDGGVKQCPYSIWNELESHPDRVPCPGAPVWANFK
jgi:type II secretory pathway pseudopilin PulG